MLHINRSISQDEISSFFIGAEQIIDLYIETEKHTLECIFFGKEKKIKIIKMISGFLIL